MNDQIKELWKVLERKVSQAVKERTQNCLRVERFDVTTAPNGSRIGVKQPFGKAILIPYSEEVSSAKVGDTVLVLWWGSLSTAKAWCFGNGPK